MFKKFKKTLSVFLALLMMAGAFQFNVSKVFGEEVTNKFDGVIASNFTNGSFVALFKSPVSLDTSKIKAEYTLAGSTTLYNAEILTVAAIAGSNNYTITFKPIVVDTAKDASFKITYIPESLSFNINLLISPSEANNKYKVISFDNGSITIEFDIAKTNLNLNDFSANYKIDNANKGTLNIRNFEKINGYNDKRYKLTYSSIGTTSQPQRITIELSYLSNNKTTTEYTLFSSGSVVSGFFGSEYDHLDNANFTIRSIKNGEIEIRFDKSINYVLGPRDFDCYYFIDGERKTNFKITEVDEDSSRYGTDFTLYFDGFETKDKDQTISVIIFYNRESKNKPAINSYVIKEDDTLYELVLTLKEIVEFTEKGTLAKISIAEKSPNLIYPSTTNSTEYIKLEAPEGFEWNLKKGSISGIDGLKNVSEYDLKYDKIRGVEQPNILLVGLTGADKNRTKKGTMELENFELIATEKAALGEVKIRISGAGIPYEKFTVAKLIAKEPVKKDYEVAIKLDSEYILVNGDWVLMDTKAFSDINNRTMIPLSFVAKAFGIAQENIKWDDISRKVTVIDGNDIIEIRINSDIIVKNNINIKMDTMAVLKDNRTFVPLRYLGEALDFTFTWDHINRVATAKRTK